MQENLHLCLPVVVNLKRFHTIDPYNFPNGWQVQMEARINTRYWYNIKFYREYSYNIHNHFKDGVFDFSIHRW